MSMSTSMCLRRGMLGVLRRDRRRLLLLPMSYVLLSLVMCLNGASIVDILRRAVQPRRHFLRERALRFDVGPWGPPPRRVAGGHACMRVFGVEGENVFGGDFEC